MVLLLVKEYLHRIFFLWTYPQEGGRWQKQGQCLEIWRSLLPFHSRFLRQTCKATDSSGAEFTKPKLSVGWMGKFPDQCWDGDHQQDALKGRGFLKVCLCFLPIFGFTDSYKNSSRQFPKGLQPQINTFTSPVRKRPACHGCLWVHRGLPLTEVEPLLRQSC